MLGGVGSQRHTPAALPPGKTRYPLYRGLGVTQGRSRRVVKSLTPPGFDPPTVQPVVSRYTNWATGPTFLQLILTLTVCFVHRAYLNGSYESQNKSGLFPCTELTFLCLKCRCSVSWEVWSEVLCIMSLNAMSQKDYAKVCWFATRMPLGKQCGWNVFEGRARRKVCGVETGECSCVTGVWSWLPY